MLDETRMRSLVVFRKLGSVEWATLSWLAQGLSTGSHGLRVFSATQIVRSFQVKNSRAICTSSHTPFTGFHSAVGFVRMG